jgi:predicted nucleic acid-binding protein
VTVVPVTAAHLTAAQALCAQEGLLTNDALLVAVTQALGLTDLASNDPDLIRLPGLTLWQPQAVPPAATEPATPTPPG